MHDTLGGRGSVMPHVGVGGWVIHMHGGGGQGGGLAHGHRDKDNKQKPGMGKSEVIIQKISFFFSF